MSNIIEGITKDLKAIPKNLKAKAGGMDTKKLVLLNLPYIFVGYFCDKVAWLWRVAEGTNASDKMMAVISGMQADIQTAKANLTVDKEQFSMKVGDKLYTDKKEAGTAIVEMCKEIKTVNAPAVIGEYAGFKMAVSFDAFNHKFVMNLKGQLSHNLEVGSDPIGNIARINHALESMPKQLMEAQTKLETVEHQLETARVEVTKPFEQEAELAEKLERLSALNALLNKDEKGNDGIDMDDEPEVPKSEEEVADRPAKHITLAEKIVGTRSDKGIRQYADAPAERVSLKAKLEVMKAKVAGGELERRNSNKKKEKEVIL